MDKTFQWFGLRLEALNMYRLRDARVKRVPGGWECAGTLMDGSEVVFTGDFFGETLQDAAVAWAKAAYAKLGLELE